MADGFLLYYSRNSQEAIRAVFVLLGLGFLLFHQWKSGFSGKVQPVRLIMTLAA